MAVYLIKKSLAATVKCSCQFRPVVLQQKSMSSKLMSKQLLYYQFGEPIDVVKFREASVPPLGSQEVLVKMLAAPVNPADINTIQGTKPVLPCLPTVPGDEGVGEVVECGPLVNKLTIGQRVIMSSRLMGTWSHYGVYHERNLHKISSKIPLVEAAMISIAPCSAYRMLKDYKENLVGETVIQNGANSACGQSVIQLCKAWGIKTFNVVAGHYGLESVKEHLYSLGADVVYTLEEAECVSAFRTSMNRPVLALNCLGGRYEDLLIKLLERDGAIVYYGGAYDLPFAKRVLRCDVQFHRFDLQCWTSCASCVQMDLMLNEIVQLIVLGKFRAPLSEPIEMKNFVHALRNTPSCEAFSTMHYVFDLTLP